MGLTDYGMEAATDNIELLGYCNQFNDNVFDENILQYESMAEFETLYGQVSLSIFDCIYVIILILGIV